MANILGKLSRESSDDDIELKRIYKDIPEETLKDLDASGQRCMSLYTSLKLSGEDVSGFNIKLPICDHSSIIYDDGEPSGSVYPPHMVILDSSESISPIKSDSPEGLVVHDGIRYVCYDALRAKMAPEHQIILDTYIDMANTRDLPIKPQNYMQQNASTSKSLTYKEEEVRQPDMKPLAIKVYQKPELEKLIEKRDSGISSARPPTEVKKEMIDYNKLPKTHFIVFNKKRVGGRIAISVPKELIIGLSKSEPHNMESSLYNKLCTMENFKEQLERLWLSPFYIKRKN